MQTTGNFNIPTPAAGTAGDASTVLGLYQKWLAAGATPSSGNYATKAVRGAGLPTSQGVCLNHFMTHINCGSVLGIANVASPSAGTAGGICDTYIFDTNGGAPFVADNVNDLSKLSCFSSDTKPSTLASSRPSHNTVLYRIFSRFWSSATRSVITLDRHTTVARTAHQAICPACPPMPTAASTSCILPSQTT